jgi:hypothetical protein
MWECCMIMCQIADGGLHTTVCLLLLGFLLKLSNIIFVLYKYELLFCIIFKSIKQQKIKKWGEENIYLILVWVIRPKLLYLQQAAIDEVKCVSFSYLKKITTYTHTSSYPADTTNMATHAPLQNHKLNWIKPAQYITNFVIVIQISELLAFWTLSIVRYSRN